MRCREASLGSLLQTVGLVLGLVSTPWVAVLAGPFAGTTAGLLSPPGEGPRNGLLAAGMGVAAAGLSVLAVTALGGSVALPDAGVLAGVVAFSLATAAIGGGAARRVRESAGITVPAAVTRRIWSSR